MPTIYFPPRVGGIESHVYYLSRELVRRGHEVQIITTRTERQSPSQEVIDGVRIQRIPSFGKHFIGWFLSSMASVPAVIQSYKRFDIIHCHTFPFALGGRIVSLWSSVPIVVTVHSSHFLRLSKKAFMRPALRFLLSSASVVLSTSEEIDKVVRELLPGAETIAIVNGVDTSFFKPSAPYLERKPGVFDILCPRRLVEKNGVEFLIRALNLLKGKLDFHAYIAGDGPLRKHLEDMVREFGIGERVTFLGSVENYKMPGIYSSSDLVVIPSLVEATSIAALEAMSCGKVVAASNVGGLPEIIDEKTGILFEPGSPQAIANAILKAATQLNLDDMGRLARERVEATWSIAKIAEMHEEIYERIRRKSGD